MGSWNDSIMDKEDLHILRLMGEIDRNGDHSQRELSRRLNISVGLVNTFLKRLVAKGYFKVTTMPRNRLKYFLTPEGLARKSKLTAEYLRYSVNFYKDIKNLLTVLRGRLSPICEIRDVAHCANALAKCTGRAIGTNEHRCPGVGNIHD